jgi:gluconolactonase
VFIKKLSIVLLLAIGLIAAAARARAQESILRLDPALDAIVSSDAKTEKLADSPGPGTREGPLWVRKGGYLLYTDFTGRAINKWNPSDNTVSTYLENSESNGLTMDRSGRVVYAATGRIMRLEKNGERTKLVSEYQGKPLNTPNDLVYKSDGALYFSDPNRPVEYTPYLYMLRNGKLQLFTLDMKFPNGMAFAPGEKYLYVNDMMSKTILKYEVRPDDTIANGQLFIDEDPTKTEPYPNVGYPDGMKVDKKGNVYCTGPGGIWIISPQGKHLGTILIVEHTVNLAFGGPDGKTLFITCRPGLYRIHLKIPGIRP